MSIAPSPPRTKMRSARAIHLNAPPRPSAQALFMPRPNLSFVPATKIVIFFTMKVKMMKRIPSPSPAAAPSAAALLALLLLGAASSSAVAAAAGALVAPGGPDSPATEVARDYDDADGATMRGYLALPDADGKVPAVIVLHDSNGLTLYERQRASLFADALGYVGFAADMYGIDADLSPEDGGWFAFAPLSGKLSDNSTLFVQRINAAVDYVRGLDRVDPEKVAVVGYCLGGTGIVTYLNNMNMEEGRMPLAGAIGIHPTIMGERPGPKPGSIKTPSLYLTGGSDFLAGPEAMAKLESDLKIGSESSDIAWETVRYAGIEHGFSDWFTENYDARADARSWHSTKTFLKAEFGEATVADEEITMDEYVAYEGDIVITSNDYKGQTLLGTLTYPPNREGSQKLPVVVLVPYALDTRERHNRRAVKMAMESGLIVFTTEHQSEELSGLLVDPMEYVSLIRSAISAAKDQPGVDGDNVAIVGFGELGGAGALYYGLLAEYDEDNGGFDESVKVIASLGGDLDTVYNVTSSSAVQVIPSGPISGGGGDWSGGAGGGDWSGAAGGGDWSGAAEGGAWSGGAAGSGSEWTGATSGGDSTWSSDSAGSLASENMNASWTSESSGSSSWTSESNGSSLTLEGSSNSSSSNGTTRRLANATKPHFLIQSGAAGDDMAKAVIPLEQGLIGIGVDYELARFSDAGGNFAVWDADGDVEGGGHDPRAASRAMDQLYTVLYEAFEFEKQLTDSNLEPSTRPAEESSSPRSFCTAMIASCAFASLVMSLWPIW
ncbi:hypothetical protein ACHAWF_017278 [Thalassiosira exigua]